MMNRLSRGPLGIVLAAVLTLSACSACVPGQRPAEIYVSPSGDEVTAARDRAVKTATAITAALTVATQSLEVADSLERSMLLKPDVLRAMAQQSKTLVKVANATLTILEGVAGGPAIDLRTTVQAVLKEFEGYLKLLDGTANETLRQLAQAVRAVLVIITAGGVA